MKPPSKNLYPFISIIGKNGYAQEVALAIFHKGVYSLFISWNYILSKLSPIITLKSPEFYIYLAKTQGTSLCYSSWKHTVTRQSLIISLLKLRS